jgi:predicted PurR-regulated permease PerM
MKITVDVETKTFVRLILVAGALAGVVFLIWRLWAPLMIVAISFFLAIALNPPVSVLSRRLPGQSRVLATALAYLVVLLVLGVFIYVAVPPVIAETVKFVNHLPAYVQQVSDQGGLASQLIAQYNLQDELSQLVGGVQQQFGTVAKGVGSSIVDGVSSVLTGFVTMLTILVLTFLMLIEGPRWMDRLWHLYNSQALLQRHKRLAAKMYKVVTSYVNGQVLVALIAAGAGLTTLLILTRLFDVPTGAVLPLTGLIFLTDMIPMVGATFGAIIVGLVLLFNDPGAALIFTVYFIIYQQIENNFIQPLVQSRTVALSALSIILAIIIGIALLGLVGGIVAIPIAGCLRILLLDYMEHRKQKPMPSANGKLAELVEKAKEA